MILIVAALSLVMNVLVFAMFAHEYITTGELRVEPTPNRVMGWMEVAAGFTLFGAGAITALAVLLGAHP